MSRNRFGNSYGVLLLGLLVFFGRYDARGALDSPLHGAAGIRLTAAGPMETLLREKLAEGQVPGTFVEASVLASGVDDPAEFCRLRDAWEQRRQLILHRGTTPAALLEGLHAVLFRKYQRDADTVCGLLDRGEYNCMSASLLFFALCQDQGMECSAVTFRGHVRIHLAALPRFDVETTCATWAQAVVPQRIDEEAGVQPRSLDPIAFLAKIYFNRATRAMQRGLWHEAVELATVACELDPHDSFAAENRLAAINEWALETCQKGDYDEALQLIRQGLRWSPHDPTLRINRRYVEYQRHPADAPTLPPIATPGRE